MLRIKFERTNRRISQKRLARDARVHQPQLSQIERGQLIPTDAQLQRLAGVLHLDPAALLQDITSEDIAVVGPTS